jgi:hypothetical protein
MKIVHMNGAHKEKIPDRYVFLTPNCIYLLL